MANGANGCANESINGWLTVLTNVLTVLTNELKVLTSLLTSVLMDVLTDG